MNATGVSGRAVTQVLHDAFNAAWWTRRCPNASSQVVNSHQIQLALDVLHELEQRDGALQGQWQMRLQRAEYEAQLAQRRYEQVDPANRLVAASLEQRWNEALVRLEETRQELADFSEVTAWRSPPATAEDSRLGQRSSALMERSHHVCQGQEGILRLLVKDITVERLSEPRPVLLHIRWQGGATEDVAVRLTASDR